MQSYAIEAAPAIAYSVSDKVTLGLSYRMTYSRSSNVVPTPLPNGQLMSTELTLDGMNFFGVLAGITYRPLPNVRIGATYRSKVTTNLEGDAKIAGNTLPAKTSFTTPHAVGLGVSVATADERLNVSLETKIAFFRDANDEIVTTVAGQPSVTPLRWRDSLNGKVGAEYFVVPSVVAVRAGYVIASSATPEAYASPFYSAPGIIHSGFLGAGVAVGRFSIDIAGTHSAASQDVAFRAPSGAPGDTGVVGGNYALSYWSGALGVTYRN